jgi:hypothetical protein
MAYYDALIAKWATLTPGTTAQKLVQINALTVAASAEKAMLTPSQILNACVPADLAALTTAQVTLLALLLSGASVDASVGTTVRAGVQAIFAGKTTTLTQLGALVAPFDNPTIPWWQANGYTSPIGVGDIGAAGLS